MQLSGDVASWDIAGPLEVAADGSKTRAPLNPDLQSIALSLRDRQFGKRPVLGGDRLQRAAREILAYGDSFLELGIEKEGVSRGDWGIAKSLYLPSLSTFVDEDEHGQLQGYWQRTGTTPRPEDVWLHPVKVLHFRYEEMGQYGNPPIFQANEVWKKLKEVSPDIEDAARALAISPWLHIMPEEWDDRRREAYRQSYEQMLQDGIITNLYLAHGADVKKAGTGSTSLAPLLDYWVKLRQQCVIPGMPLWLFPGLGAEDKAGKDLAGQPALAYFRLISAIRSILGEQIKWAIAVELCLKKGFDWYIENGQFDVVWGEWALLPQEAPASADAESSSSTDSQQSETVKRVQSLLADDLDTTDLPELNLLSRQLDALILEGQSSQFSQLFQLSIDLNNSISKLTGVKTPSLNGRH